MAVTYPVATWLQNLRISSQLCLFGHMDLGRVPESGFCAAATKHLSQHPREETGFIGFSHHGGGGDEAEQHRSYPDSQEAERRDASTGLLLWNAIL